MSAYWLTRMLIYICGVALLAFVGIFWCVFRGQYLLGALACIGFILCLVSAQQLKSMRYRILESDTKEYLTSLQNLVFEKACEKAEESCIAVPHELANLGGFLPPKDIIRYRCFEWREVVFRIEEDRTGTVRFVLRNAKCG